jgi:hypothetical protein
MADALPRPTVEYNSCTHRGQKTRYPVDPSPQEAQVGEQIRKERPVHSVKSFSYVHFEQDARDTVGVEEL